MPKRPALTKAEFEVAQIVWKLGEARVRDVVEAMPDDPKPDFWTVQTYLRRLKAKGYLRTRREGRADVYLPAVRPNNVVREAVQEFINRVFGGEPVSLVQHLINDADLTDEQIQQLQQTLEQLKRREDR